MTTITAAPILSYATVAEITFYGMKMCLQHDFGTGTTRLLTRTTRTGLARYAPSTVKAPQLPDTLTFTEMVPVAHAWLQDRKVAIWSDDRERLTETAADYLR
jgi:hypothetical protein